MTLSGPQFPLSLSAARQHLTDALGANYGGPVDPDTLKRALSVDALTVGEAVHPRPWFTAARLIRDNTEYEVGGSLNAQIDRKIKGLEDKQRDMDALAGILYLLPGAEDGRGWPPMGGAVETVGRF